MPRKPQKGGAVRLPEETIDQLRTLSKKLNYTQPFILATLIDMCAEYDLLNPDWIDRINAALARGSEILQAQRLENLKDRCNGLRYANKNHKCIMGRKDMTPLIRILAPDLDEALDLCVGCKLTLDPVLKNYALQEKVQQLEARLKGQVGQKFKAPICNRGAVLTNEGIEFRTCPERSFDKPVSIEKWCKVYSHGLPCPAYAEVVMGVANKKSETKVKN